GGQVICGRTETAMTPESVRKLGLLSRQLSASLMSAALCAKEIGEITRAETDDTGGLPGANVNRHPRKDGNAQQRPLLDEATLSVIWRGRTLHLGHGEAERCIWGTLRASGC
ncbi:MAG: hypothetical protein NT031_05695, partial [Planctomycetota bacterium]|nr:hypothetical protein [Planctomycetota bacterium]